MTGPLPNPQARRRNAGSGFVTLHRSGRAGPPPPYPLRADRCRYSGRRKALWEELWATPMAMLWERHKWTVPVARYVELLLAYEAAPLTAPGVLLSELRQAEEKLAMTASGLLKARASIDLTAVPAAGAPSATVTVLLPRTSEADDSDDGTA